MAQTFSATIDAWARKSEARMLAIFQTASQYFIKDVIDRTRRDTGYLVNSLTVNLDGPLPMREGARPPPGTPENSYEPQPYALTIAGAPLGGTIFGSFIAEYAAVREAYDQMIGLSAQNWKAHVAKASAEARARVRSG